MNPVDRASQGFREAYGAAPDGVAFAPGRVNLIGDHVDYNDGLVLPMPISAGTAVAWGHGARDAVEAVALDYGDEHDRFALDTVEPPECAGWRTYLRGISAALRSRCAELTGARLSIAGSIPRGSGLSSSASLCVALGRALVAASPPGGDVAAVDLARAAQQAEHGWAGVHCGIMDQMAVAAGMPGQALLLDCRDLANRHIPLPDSWAVMIVQSGVVRGLVDGHYNDRRAECEAAARTLGVASLRDASAEMVETTVLNEPLRSRAMHVVAEIARVENAVTAIEAADLEWLGELLRASHASLRDLFAVSEPKVDALVEIVNAAIGPMGGARMTGGGFGGAVVAVVSRDNVDRVRVAIERDYRTPDGELPDITVEGVRVAACETVQ